MIWSEKFSSRKWDGVHEMFRIQKKIYHMMILSLYQKKERQKAPDDTTLSKFRYSSGYLSEIFDFFQANKKNFCMRKIRVVWHFSLLFLAPMPLKKEAFVNMLRFFWRNSFARLLCIHRSSFDKTCQIEVFKLFDDNFFLLFVESNAWK